ncbi:MAG: hypothetical protein EOP45_22830, partial [Sphingobacteriaceae bacterium]
MDNIMVSNHSHVPFFSLFVLLFIVILWLSYHLRKALNFRRENQDLVKQYNTYQNTTTLYETLGGGDTVRIAVDNAVTALLAEASLSNVFAVVGSSGHRSGAQLKSCLDAQFSTLLGYALPYPTKTLTRGAIVKARDMASSHRKQNLGITQQQFNTFVSILATSLVQSGVPQANVNALAPQLTAMSVDIVG